MTFEFPNAQATMYAVFVGVGGYVVLSIAEYLVHRHLMHRKRLAGWFYQLFPVFNQTFRAHATLHHGKYYKQFDHEPDTVGRYFNLGPGWVTCCFLIILMLPLSAAVFVVSPAGSIVLLVEFVLYLWLWGWLHREMHVPSNSWVRRTGLFRVLARKHFLHHRHRSANFNLVLPLADYLFGTVATANQDDINEMRRMELLP